MFDIGFLELAVIAVVGLIVIGPERLPKVARTAGHWIGRGRRFVASVKADIDKEIRAEELKRVLDEQAAKANPLHEVIEETRKDLDEIKRDTQESVNASQTRFVEGKDKDAD
jgi:sec-independent protein translocase protein TatB